MTSAFPKARVQPSDSTFEASSAATPGDGPAGDLAAFLRRNRTALLEHWSRGIGSGQAAWDAARAAGPGLADLIDSFAESAASRRSDPGGIAVTQASERYALGRLGEGASLGQVISGPTRLRAAVADLWKQRHGHDLSGPGLRLLNDAVDTAIAAASEAYVAARDRVLRTLDRISSIAFERRQVDDLLQRLLEIIVEPTMAVDTGSILLRDGDVLVVRAAVGLEEGRRGIGFRLPIGEGFAGRIAAERRPRLLAEEQIAAEAVSPVVKARPLRVLYGVPLETGGELLGVAHIGSATVAAFTDQDRGLFEAMCVRAAAAINQYLLQEASEIRARELAALVQSIPEAVFVADAGGVRHANQAALGLLGVDSVERLNRPAQSLAEVIEARHPDTGAPLAPDERFFTRALRGETTTTEVMVRHLRTRQDVILQCAIAPVRSAGKIVGAVAACTDITQRKSAEAARDRLYDDARQAVADRQHVLGVVSHDLRNPLNTILLVAETLKDEDAPAEFRLKGLSAIVRAATRMNGMISDLLDVHSIEAGRLTLSLLPQDPRSVVDEVMELFAPQAASRGIHLSVEAPESLPLVRGDRRRLVQALSNLVSNALKVTADGSVTLRVESRAQEVVFAVVDTGPGIPANARADIFEPYWRAQRATYNGTGLGLAIVRGIVEGHGGRVWIEDGSCGGAAFLFSVPAA